jgi:outer membrane protein assembly factor BamB
MMVRTFGAWAALLSAAAPGVAAAEEATVPVGFVRPEADELRPVYGLRLARKLAEVEPLDIHPAQWSSPFIGEDNTLAYVATDQGVLHALWISSGRTLWKRSDLGQLGRAMGQVGDVLIVGAGGFLIGLEGFSGKEVWRTDVGGVVGGAIVRTGTVAIVPIRPNTFLAIDGGKGEVLWRVKRPKPEGITVRGQAAPAVDPRRGRVYLGSSDGYLLAVSLETGETAWAVKLSAPAADEPFGDVDTTPVLLSGGRTIAAAAYNHGVFGLDAEDGRILWRNLSLLHVTDLAEVPGAPWLVASIGDGQVAGFDPQGGGVRWRYRLSKGVPTGPIPLEAGFVAVGSSKGPLAILESMSGRPVQLVTPGSGMSADPFARGPDLAVWTNKGLFLALRLGEGTGIVQ